MPHRPLFRPLWAGLLAALLVGCGSVSTGNAGTGTLDSGTTSRADAMAFRPTTVPPAYVGEPYNTPFGVTGGVGPYGYRLTAGTLPPGLKINNATLSGVPTKSGNYTFSVQATDANLSTRVQEYTMKVEALPPLSLEVTLPPSEIRGQTRLPLAIKAPRNVRAARLSWDIGPNVKVTQVQPSDSGSILFWEQKGTVLTVDVGFRTVPRPNARIALLTVRPVGNVRLTAEKLAYEARDGAGKILSEKKLPAPAPAPAKTPADGKAADAKAPAQGGTAPSNTAPSSTTPNSAAPGTNAPATTPASTAPASTTTPDTPPPAATAPSTTVPSTPATPADVDTSPLPSPATPTPSSPPPANPASAEPNPTNPAPTDPAPTDPASAPAQPTPPTTSGGQ